MENLIKALAKARMEFKPVQKTATNPAFRSKYAPLANIIEATTEALSANGLIIMQITKLVDGKEMMITTLYHESGDSIESATELVDMEGNRGTNQLQQLGAALTYLKRYQMELVLGVAGEDDTDGNDKSQSQPQGKRDTKGKAGRVVGETYSGDGIIADNKPKTEPAKDKDNKEKLMAQIHAVGTQKGYDHDAISKIMTEFYEVESMKDLTIEQLKAGIARLNKKPDKPAKTADHQKIAEDVANATGFKVDDILEYFEAQEWDWKYIAQEHIKWIADDRAKEKFATDVSGYMASKNQPELPESEA